MVGTRKRKWDLDDQGHLHQDQAIEELEKKKKGQGECGGHVETLKEAENFVAKEGAKPVKEEEKVTVPKESVEAAKEAAQRISAILAAKESKTFELKGDDIQQHKASPSVTRGTSIAATVGLDLEGDNSKKVKVEGRFKKVIDVNDNRHRYHLIKRTTLNEVEAYSGSTTVVIGKYYPDRALVTEKDPALSLEIVADSQSKVDRAEEKINEIMEHGPAVLRPTELTDKVFALFDPDWAPNMNIRAKILGPQGSYLRHIQNESGARAHLRGKGSGHVEIGQKVEQMHILLQADRQAELDYARKLAEDLLATVGREVEVAKMIPAGMAGQGMYYPYGSMMPGNSAGYQQQMPPQYPHIPGQYYPGYNAQQPLYTMPTYPSTDQQQQQQQPDYTNVPPPQSLYK